MILYGVGASGIIGLVLVLALFAFAGGGGSSSATVESAMTDAGCTFKTYKEQPRTPHFATTPPAKPFKYNSFPPSSGRHYFQTVTYGFYDQPVDKYSVVHNLEHGAILVYWGSKVPKSEVAKIRQWWKDDARGIVASPLPALGQQDRRGRVDARREVHGVRRQGVLEVPRHLPVQGRRSRSRPSRWTRARSSAPPRRIRCCGRSPGWRNWSDAPGLKPGALAGMRVRFPPPALCTVTLCVRA